MNFAAHSLLGLVAGALAALAVAAVAPRTLATASVPLAVPAAILVLVYLGSVYPDVDLQDSIPRRRVLPYLKAGAVGGVALLAYTVPGAAVDLGSLLLSLVEVSAHSAIAGAIGLGFAAAVAVVAVEPVLDVLTGAHRTWTHSVAAHALGATLVVLGLWFLSPIGDHRPLIAALPYAFVVGVAVHHLADDVA
jgi:hypothetical protein